MLAGASLASNLASSAGMTAAQGRSTVTVARARADASGAPGRAPMTAAQPRSGVAPREYSCPILPARNPLNQDVSHAPLDVNSAGYIDAIGAAGHLHADFGSNPSYGIPYAVVPPNQKKVPIHFTAYGEESNPGPYPIPGNAPVEGAGEVGDRHVLVLQRGSCRLYELYAARRLLADHRSLGWEGGSGGRLHLRRHALRPDGWTSADAAGLPIFPLLVRYPEVRAGRIDHALRVTVEHTQKGFTHPATHYAAQSTEPSLPQMGLRGRLQAGFDLSPYHGEALVVLRALKRYGLIVGDNGSPRLITRR